MEQSTGAHPLKPPRAGEMSRTSTGLPSCYGKNLHTFFQPGAESIQWPLRSFPCLLEMHEHRYVHFGHYTTNERTSSAAPLWHGEIRQENSARLLFASPKLTIYSPVRI